MVTTISMIRQLRSAFTLLEVIVAVTVLAILATVAFTAYNGYFNSSRDGARLQDITKIHGSLVELKAKKSILPIPESAIILTGSGG